MQVSWARALLGIEGSHRGSWLPLIAECGWEVRLGTKVMGLLLMFIAQVETLPINFPVVQAWFVAKSVVIPFSSADNRLRLKLDNVQTVRDWLQVDAVRDLGINVDERLKILQRYKKQVVYPALRRYDDDAFQGFKDAHGWPYLQFQPFLQRFPRELLQANWQRQHWRDYQLWALVRCTGRWPLPLGGMEEFPRLLSFCPLCQKAEAGVTHLLVECEGTFLPRQKLLSHCVVAGPLICHLFQNRPCPHDDELDSLVEYVADACWGAIERIRLLEGTPQWDLLFH